MAIARKCDKCGKFFEVYIIPSGFCIDFHAGLVTHTYDLCADCAQAFKSWIGENKEDQKG